MEFTFLQKKTFSIYVVSCDEKSFYFESLRAHLIIPASVLKFDIGRWGQDIVRVTVLSRLVNRICYPSFLLGYISKPLCVWTLFCFHEFSWPLSLFLFVGLDFLLQLVSCHINNVSSILEQNHSNIHHLWNLALLMTTPSSQLKRKSFCQGKETA